MPELAMPAFDHAAEAEKLTAILADLVATPTDYPPGNTVSLAQKVAGELRQLGYRVGVHERSAGLANVIASIGSGAPHLMFNAHMDTVGVGERAEWRTDPFVLTQIGDRLYGLGASNCKGSMAVHLWLARRIAAQGGPARGTVSFTFVADEESLGTEGMAYLRADGIARPDLLCLGAPTGNTAITAERGVMWVAVTTTGKAAHAGAPEMGDNAILRMLRILDHLRGNLLPAIAARRDGPLRSTVNLGRIFGGENTNVVPSRCRIELDRRLLPFETVKTAFAEIEEAVGAAGEPDGTWACELMRGTNGFASARDGALIKALDAGCRAATGKPLAFADAIGASDGRWFADDGIEIVNFGPGGGSEGHASNEFISQAELASSAAIHEAMVGHLLGFKAQRNV